jgi:hypothetical protein
MPRRARFSITCETTIDSGRAARWPASHRALLPPAEWPTSASGAAVGLLLAISSLQHLLMLAAHESIIASHWLRLLLGPLAAAQATLAALARIWALVLIVRHWNHLGRAQSMVHTLTDRVPSKAHAQQARLSAREHQVLELIRT